MLKRFYTLAVAALILSGTASAYTYWVHYTSRVAPFTPIPRKYDLNALWNNTIFYYISDASLVLAANDSPAGAMSQIRAAAKVWNDVDASNLRLAFGGIYTDGTPQSSAGIQVAFSDEIPPGLWALTGVSEASTINLAPGGNFIPIAGARISLPRDLRSRPSFGEGFFQTVVHEFGHALGLQHTMTSATMSTEVTRGTSKGKPLAVDDIAGISGLYPSRTYGLSTGSISGRVTMGGDPVNLASVVSISFGGVAVSALTNPDGTYRIDGIPVGSGYMVYAHPLPPALSGESYPAAIEPPVDAQGVTFPASGPFNVQFYPGTSNWAQATQVTVNSGVVSEGVNFNVVRRASALPLYSVQTFSFPGLRPYIVASGIGLNASVGVGLLNSAESIAPNGVKTYPYGSGYVQIDIQSTNFFAAEGPRHLIFSRDNDLYILPGGFNLVQRQPPSISSVTPAMDASGSRTAIIAGTGLGADTRIWFDGVQ
ncbi:MAG: matrixin family metalloprotease, partial [Acidobacteria bacterium]|nr:matrixin family metalloprotease [Acidobacteriota bacterium]